MYACGEVLTDSNPEITISGGDERFTLMNVEELRDALAELMERRHGGRLQRFVSQPHDSA
jgi:hypothetical protein